MAMEWVNGKRGGIEGNIEEALKDSKEALSGKEEAKKSDGMREQWRGGMKGLLNSVKGGDEKALNDSRSTLKGDAVVLQGDR